MCISFCYMESCQIFNSGSSGLDMSATGVQRAAVGTGMAPKLAADCDPLGGAVPRVCRHLHIPARSTAGVHALHCIAYIPSASPTRLICLPAYLPPMSGVSQRGADPDTAAGGEAALQRPG